MECDRLTRRSRARDRRGRGSIGDVVAEDGDWFGTPVVEAARLCAACDASC
ncbi:MAG: hypothetical protein R2726_17000 [Acidimicrobiales bacterium]